MIFSEEARMIVQLIVSIASVLFSMAFELLYGLGDIFKNSFIPIRTDHVDLMIF